MERWSNLFDFLNNRKRKQEQNTDTYTLPKKYIKYKVNVVPTVSS